MTHDAPVALAEAVALVWRVTAHVVSVADRGRGLLRHRWVTTLPPERCAAFGWTIDATAEPPSSETGTKP